MLEIKDKIDTNEAMLMKGAEPAKVVNSNLEDVIEALTMLGYSKQQILKVIDKLDSTKDTEQLIKDALKEITNIR